MAKEIKSPILGSIKVRRPIKNMITTLITTRKTLSDLQDLDEDCSPHIEEALVALDCAIDDQHFAAILAKFAELGFHLTVEDDDYFGPTAVYCEDFLIKLHLTGRQIFGTYENSAGEVYNLNRPAAEWITKFEPYLHDITGDNSILCPKFND